MFLKLNNLKKLYNAENGLKHLDLTVEKGSFVTLLGPSGCGKSTTLNILGGFLPVDEGQVLLDGQDITHLPPEQRPISTVFQSYALFPHLSVLENVCYGLRFSRRMKKQEAAPLAKEFLAVVGLEGYEKARVGNLSGGQQQRVALARSMATEPKILLLDEPLSNLDANLRSKMRLELKELQKTLGVTMIFVTHDQEEALCLSDQLVVMDKGEVVQMGTPRDVYFHPHSQHVSSFIGKSNYVVENGQTKVVRPEDIAITPKEGADYTIQSVTFMGARTEYLLVGPNGTLEANCVGYTASQMQPGQQVTVSIGHSFVLPQ